MARSERKRRQDGFATFGFRQSGVKKRDAPVHGAEIAPPAPAGGRPEEAPGTRARVVKPRETRDGAIYMEDDRKVVDQQGRDVYAGEREDEEVGEPKIFTHRPPGETRELHIDEPAGPADEDEYLEEFEEDAIDDAAGDKAVHGEADDGGEAGDRGVYMPPEEELTTDELLSRLEEGKEEVWDPSGDEAGEGEGAGPDGDADGGAVSIDWDDAGDQDDGDEAPKQDVGTEDDGGEAEPVIFGEVEEEAPEETPEAPPDAREPEPEEPQEEFADGSGTVEPGGAVLEPVEVPEEEAFMSDEYMAASREAEEEETMLREAAEAAALERRERAKAARYQEILERKRKEARAAAKAAAAANWASYSARSFLQSSLSVR